MRRSRFVPPLCAIFLIFSFFFLRTNKSFRSSGAGLDPSGEWGGGGVGGGRRRILDLLQVMASGRGREGEMHGGGEEEEEGRGGPLDGEMTEEGWREREGRYRTY